MSRSSPKKRCHTICDSATDSVQDQRMYTKRVRAGHVEVTTQARLPSITNQYTHGRAESGGFVKPAAKASASAAATSPITSRRLAAQNPMSRVRSVGRSVGSFSRMNYFPERASIAAFMDDSESTRKFAEVTTRSPSLRIRTRSPAMRNAFGRRTA